MCAWPMIESFQNEACSRILQILPGFRFARASSWSEQALKPFYQVRYMGDLFPLLEDEEPVEKESQ